MYVKLPTGMFTPPSGGQSNPAHVLTLHELTYTTRPYPLDPQSASRYPRGLTDPISRTVPEHPCHIIRVYGPETAASRARDGDETQSE